MLERSALNSYVFHQSDWYVVITEDPYNHLFEAWLSLNPYGIYSYMFGFHCDTLDQFLSVVEGNLDTYKRGYISDLKDSDPDIEEHFSDLLEDLDSDE